jgi:hypothetical protein
MEDVFLSAMIDENREICISPIPARTYQAAGGKGLGGEFGYFIYETDKRHPESGIEIIGKVASVEAAMRLFQLLVSNVKPLENPASCTGHAYG